LFVVTGAAGFIGSSMVKYLVKNELIEGKILLIDKLTYAGDLNNLTEVLNDPNIIFIESDIADTDRFTHFIDHETIIVNFAAESHVDRSIKRSDEFIHSNILSAFNLLRLFHEKKGRIFMQISTDEVYGSVENGFASEDALVNPNSPYSGSKASADILMMSYARTFNLDLRISRCGNNFGPNQHPEKLLPMTIINTIENKDIPIYGNGLNIRNWIYVYDHCQAIWEIIKSGRAQQIYNIAGENYFQNVDLVEKVMKTIGFSNSKVKYVEDRLGHDFRYAISSKKIEQSLGFYPKHKFEDALGLTINWYRNNPNWWLQKTKSIKS
jgi:dTDP-glucose 4,6-dehydratase